MDKCKWCDSHNLNFTKTPNLTHFGRIDCLDCGRWNEWIRNPENDGIRTRTSRYNISQVLRFYNKKDEICFFCLRKKEQLGEKETLTLDHIEELKDGGKDELGNIQVLCSACHKLKNWARLYMNWHLNKFYENDTITTKKRGV